MIILAVETSCDDTCVSVIKAKERKEPIFEILSNVVSSQVEIHKKWGGVYPTLARREHQKNLVLVLTQSLSGAGILEKSKIQISNVKSNLKSKCQILEKILERDEYLYKKLKSFLGKYEKPKVDAIAVTVGPGLEPCLWVGVNFAKALAFWWDLPIIPVNHIEAHIFANLLPQIRSISKIKEQKSKIQIKNQKLEKIIFPAVCLVVSGGHTQLILMKNFGRYKILGETRDDAAGECFDKTARILGLGYPGGPSVAKMATKIKNQISKIKNIKLPRPMMYSRDYDFSFSGLKTAVLYDFKKRSLKIKKSKQYIQAMAAEIQQAVIDVLIKKTLKAARDYKAKTIILGGGVAANEELRKQFQEKIKKEIPDSLFLTPAPGLCTDNAAMVGTVACFYRKKRKIKHNWQKIKADGNLRIG